MTDVTPRPPTPRLESLACVVFAYLVALAAALWVLPFLGAWRPLSIVIAADVVATLVIFFFSMRWNNGSVYDPYWSVVPPLIALFWIGAAEEAVPLRQLVVTVLVFAWGIRLTFNWVRGWPGLHHEDWRYVDLYVKAPLPKWATSLFGIHLFPTVIVLLGCLPLIPALASGRAVWGLLDSLALLVTAGAILIETLADEQLRRFSRTKQPGDIIDEGLWAGSRHPNYFGEMSFWWGLFLFGFSANTSYWWTIIGPISMTVMFHLASIPMLDQRSLQRRPGYAEHVRRVNAVLPRFRS
jgi:steroid 5-alpha reductase family enzyme